MRTRAQARVATYRPDAVFEIRAPDDTRGLLLVEAKSPLTARLASDLGPRLAPVVREGEAAGALVVTRFASELSQDRLRRAGVSYLDLTGNAWISLDRPGLLITTQGASKDPSPPRRGVRSLKGAKAARLVRAICDWRPPVGVRDLAKRAGTDPGYTSRVIRLLEDEDLVGRDSTGQVKTVDWQGLLRRWSRDYDVAKTNRAVAYLAPRGLSAFGDQLREYDERYAVTGSLAVPAAAAVAPGRLASCYVQDPERVAERFDLRPVDAGANVLLLEPFDEVVYERSRGESGLRVVALSQCVVDLLTGTGREPAEAESLLSWMAASQDAWRA
ncbi:MAG: hypothetical protein HY700_07060 [Gemmatimonadetes bacterium]|nr:hypothetical protein [Gemmatimonadota bacterium]